MRLKHASLARKLQHVDMHGHDLATLDHVELAERHPGLPKRRSRVQHPALMCEGAIDPQEKRPPADRIARSRCGLEEFERSEYMLALNNLREAIFRTYADFVKSERRRGGPSIGSGAERRPKTEHERRESAVYAIEVDLLDGRPLESFSARHLEVLQFAVAYWVELIEAEDAPINAPEPDAHYPVRMRPPPTFKLHHPGLKPATGSIR